MAALSPDSTRTPARARHWRPVFGAWMTAYRRTWKGSIASRFLSPLLFLLSMGLGLGSLVDQSAGGVGGVPYLQYVVPGILAMQAMMTASPPTRCSVPSGGT